MICDIAIPIWNKKELTEQCVNSILANTDFPYRIILVDNASSEPAKSYLESVAGQYPDKVKLIANKENLGNTGAGVQGMKYSDADYVCILDNDTIVCKGWLEEMVRIAEMSPNIGIVNPNSNSFGLNRKPGESLEDFASSLMRENSGKYVEIGAAVGFCYLVKRKVMNEAGYWDEGFSPGYYEDTEYAMRIKKYGYKSVIASGAYVYHDEHSSFKSKEKKRQFEGIFGRSRERYYASYGRHKRILYVISRSLSDVKAFNEKIYAEADKCNFVDVIVKRRYGGIDLIRHGNVRKIVYGDAFFRLKVWLKVLTKKKRYDAVFYNI
ncbi:MAG: glycosyltransferase family 2 protein [Candidatus Omnitrophota bacterium]